MQARFELDPTHFSTKYRRQPRETDRRRIKPFRTYLPVIIGTPDFQFPSSFVRVYQLEVGRVDAPRLVRRRRRRGAGESPEYDPRRFGALLDAHLSAGEEALQVAAGRGGEQGQRDDGNRRLHIGWFAARLQRF